MHIVSIQVGKPTSHQHTTYEDGNPVEWVSGIYKLPVSDRVCVGRTNLEGDGQADLKNHGGPDKAVHMYPVEHYAFWRAERGLTHMADGTYGENITTSGMDENTVCLGDEYAIGECVLQISQPRVPCWKPARKFGMADLARQVLATGRTGWYLRVLREGHIQAGDPIKLRARPQPLWTINACNNVMHPMRANLDATRGLASIPELAESWRHSLMRHLA